MHFGFALELSDIDLWNIDLLDTHLDLLDTNITSKNFVCLRDVLKTSSRYVFKTSSRHVFKTSSRRLGRRKIVTLKTSWRRLEDMSWRCLEDMSWRCQACNIRSSGLQLYQRNTQKEYSPHWCLRASRL